MTESVKRRKRIYGSFVCEYSGCGKAFTRSDHLNRHQKNHDPSRRIECPYPDCDQSFVRTDVRDKHYKRHLMKQDMNQDEENSVDNSDSYSHSHSNVKSNSISNSTSNSNSDLTRMNDNFTPGSITNSTSELVNKDNNMPHATSPVTSHSVITSRVESPLVEFNNYQVPSISQAQTPYSLLPTTKTLSPSDLIEWLFHDPLGNGNQGDTTSSFHHDFNNGVSPISLLDSMFAVSPNFPHSMNRKNVDENLRQKLIKLIPSLDLNIDFGLVQIERCLEIYWLIYHPQYPLLHKPSFSNDEAQPLLLLAMIMLGASISSCTGFNEKPILRNPQILALEIAEPLRWLIFANKDCRPPAKVWVVQSLLLLESFEITSANRVLHERAYLHHGTKIQLLRRSPILGGDPLKDEDEDGAYLPPNHVWKKWIEVESMKRATLMAFYLDTVNATVYGHLIILYAHQIKISLPCEDELWEFDNSKQIESQLINDKPPKFLMALRKLLHRQKVKTSAFGRKVLLAGLLTIMFQMQQKDLQLTFLEWDRVKESWNETISMAIDVWRTEICQKSCCNTNNSISFSNEDKPRLPSMLRENDTRCKFSLYHISQIYMRITHYDYIIYAGAPARMNVKSGSSEYAIVSKRVMQWAESLNGRISVIHAYLFLFEMLLSPDNEDIAISYDPNIDPFLHRKNIVASAILVIFAYNFVLDGPESNEFELSTGNFYPDKEDGYSYLRRIRKELSLMTPLDINFSYSNNSSSEFHNNIILLASKINNIENKHNIVGLLKVFHKSYENSHWEVGREYAKLFKNCVERCLGRKKVTCDDMYSNNL